MALPSNRTGTDKGKTIMALKIALLPKDSAQPKDPKKLIIKEPNNKLDKRGKRIPSGRYRKIAPINEAIRIGAPVTNQEAKTFAKIRIKRGSPLITIWSKVPSLKSSLKMLSIASRDAKRTAIHNTPGEMKLSNC